MSRVQDKEDLTPMLAQYHHFKGIYEYCLLFFRLGDFYELFYKDAVVGSRELGLVLTSRPAGKGRERIPMCGVPYHSAENYISRLISKGYRVAICEQIEEATKGRGIVKREVTRVITPGTYFEKDSRGLGCAMRRGKGWLFAYLNLAVGDFFGVKSASSDIYDLITKFQVRELLIKKGEDVEREKLSSLGVAITELDADFFESGEEDLKEFVGVPSLRALGFESDDLIPVLGGAYRYAQFTQKSFTPFISKPKPFVDEGFVRIDFKAVRGLEVIESSEGRKDHSLFGVIDRTLTGMGRRRLRFHLLNPYRSAERIKEVQDAVEKLIQDPVRRERIREILEGMGDLERLVSKISGGMASPRELVQLKNALFRSMDLKEEVKDLGGYFELLSEDIEDLKDVAVLIDRTLVDNPPVHVKEGGLIRVGVNSGLDELRFIKDSGEKLLRDYEERLRRETGIQSLKVGFNRVIGYYIEVTRPNLRLVPANFKRRQTLTNAERFITDELSRLEEKVLSAHARIRDLEYEIYTELRKRVLERVESIGRTARAVGEIDYVQSLAHLAHQKGWIRPEVDNSITLEIEEGRHPVIEEFTARYVPNSTMMNEGIRIHIITGPNMAGKSSYSRQVALIVLLAHMGSFVPAKRARIGVVDGIFTRIGSGDVLALGVSTFMNEMLDVSALLNLATERSLVILDEIGRGTSTYDGIALSKAIVEYIALRLRCRTVVATHFLELTDLEKEVEGVKNFHMEVSGDGDKVVFLYRLARGVAKSSFGIEVAKMAGIPTEVVKRAREFLKNLGGKLPVSDQRGENHSTSSKPHEILREIKGIEVANITPLEALLKISAWKEKLRLRETQD